jgi:hypothetical protein
MKMFKKIDFWTSVILIVSITIICIDSKINHLLDNYLFSPYLIVGLWQLISMIVHAYNHWFTTNKGMRYTYHWIIVIALATLPIGSAWLLLSTGPFLIVFYTWICYEEVYKKMRRPLSYLK